MVVAVRWNTRMSVLTLMGYGLMALKKLISVSIDDSVYVDYVWHDYVLLFPRIILFLALSIAVGILIPFAKFAQWLVNHPKLHPFDRRVTNDE